MNRANWRFSFLMFVTALVTVLTLNILPTDKKHRSITIKTLSNGRTVSGDVFQLSLRNVTFNFNSTIPNTGVLKGSRETNLSHNNQEIDTKILSFDSIKAKYTQLSVRNNTEKTSLPSVKKKNRPKRNFEIYQRQNFSLEEFIKIYSKMCEQLSQEKGDSSTMALCPCTPATLWGRIKIKTMQSPKISNILKNNSEVHPGGYWKPQDCYARDRIAIIIPFRDRQSHLNILLKYLHPFLQRQQIEYRIFVVEQTSPTIFNKASLMNAGYLEVQKSFRFDCVVFHDVDMIPEDDRNFYSCMNSPRHITPYVNKWKYKIKYITLIGGALLLKPKQFEQINGFSNKFYGWGGEDDDIYERLRFNEIQIYRYPKCVARYTMIKHDRDTGNPDNDMRPIARLLTKSYQTDGLNSIQYHVRIMKNQDLYTLIHIDLPEKNT